jgi:hypothetical protein
MLQKRAIAQMGGRVQFQILLGFSISALLAERCRDVQFLAPRKKYVQYHFAKFI